LAKFTDNLEAACIETVEAGFMTKDLALCIHGNDMKRNHWMESKAFLDKLAETLSKKLHG